MQTQMIHCEECGIPLKKPESIAKRIGPECERKHAMALATISTAREALATAGEDFNSKELKAQLRHYDWLNARADEQRQWRTEVQPVLLADIRKARARIAYLMTKIQRKPVPPVEPGFAVNYCMEVA